MKNIYRNTATTIAFCFVFSLSFAGENSGYYNPPPLDYNNSLQREAERARIGHEGLLRDLEMGEHIEELKKRNAERENALRRQEMELELLRLQVENERSRVNNRQPSHNAVPPRSPGPVTNGMECFEDDRCSQGLACRLRKGDAYKCK